MSRSQFVEQTRFKEVQKALWQAMDGIAAPTNNVAMLSRNAERAKLANEESLRD